MVKKITGKLDVLQKKSTDKLISLPLWKNLQESLKVLFCRPLKNITMFGPRPKTLVSICFHWKRVKDDISLIKDQEIEAQKKLRKEPKNLLIETSTRPITCIATRSRDLYERLLSEMENKSWQIMDHSPLFLNYKRNIQAIIKVTFRLCVWFL